MLEQVCICDGNMLELALFKLGPQRMQQLALGCASKGLCAVICKENTLWMQVARRHYPLDFHQLMSTMSGPGKTPTAKRLVEFWRSCAGLAPAKDATAPRLVSLDFQPRGH